MNASEQMKNELKNIGRNESWINVTNQIRHFATTTLGKTKPGCRHIDKETWWWDAEIQKAVRKKKETFKKWQSSGRALKTSAHTKTKNRRYGVHAVSSAKSAHYKEMYGKLSTKEEENHIYKLAKSRNLASQDIEHVSTIKGADNKLIWDGSQVKYYNGGKNTSTWPQTKNSRIHQ